ncbi:hypothetical protein EDB87DRAFT_1638153 [Lactarius vividus]|nr:hypothetical protein EDB87DRAFT_1638153 [Lactarius vividus]
MLQDSERGDDAALPSHHHFPPNQAQIEVVDGSEAIFNMYLEMSLRKDKESVESWNQDAKSILLFSGLFSATVAAALGSSLPNHGPGMDVQAASAFFLGLVYEIASNSTELVPFPIHNATKLREEAFNSTYSAKEVARNLSNINTLWYSSLIISLTCALFAILSQQWARQYLIAVRERDAPYNQARIREFLAKGIQNSGLALLVDAMWASHQLSFMLFILGFLILFFHIGDEGMTFSIILIWSLFWSCLYLWMSIAGSLRKDSPYHTPLSSLINRFSQLIWGSKDPPRHSSSNRVEETLGLKMTEESTWTILQGLDSRTLKWTFDSLNQDHEFERFFAGIPSFCNSRAVANPVGCLCKLNEDKQKLSHALIGLMHRTMTSHLISEPIRRQRIRICTRAIDAVPDLVSLQILRRVLGEWEGLLESVDFGSAILRTSGNRNSDPHTAFCACCIVAIVIARRKVYGDHWSGLTSQFITSDMEVWDGTSRFTLRGYLEHGYSALLANLIFITRTILRFHYGLSQNVLSDISSKTLSEVLSNIDMQLASPEMRREFCRLWNDLVQIAQDGTSPHTPTIATEILRHLRKSYIALHESTDTSRFYTSPNDDNLFRLLGSSYPSCDMHNHRTSPQTQPPTTMNSTSPPSPRLSLSAPQDTIPQNVVAGATEDVNEVSLPAEATPGLSVAPSALTAPGSPLDTQLSVEIPPTVQENHDAPVAQSVRISSNLESLESPSLTPDAGPSAAVPTTF